MCTDLHILDCEAATPFLLSSLDNHKAPQTPNNLCKLLTATAADAELLLQKTQAWCKAGSQLLLLLFNEGLRRLMCCYLADPKPPIAAARTRRPCLMEEDKENCFSTHNSSSGI